ncbi:Magnesium transporter MRS2-4 isoform A [Chlorella sorokiniana]|uniref:Magnesium transporter n=1 Tax=Chlorella sorokiniana TaxID=3076 RepID=A0A2P6TSC6_CHLSO|nr:Magnesium transporter MRS2-4 isoform A [Chlorella sorokiniana]|eukprot:PRW56958.1 Magnesium transporter MRS2-4 isoform A [Chlorella sorokiniana]
MRGSLAGPSAAGLGAWASWMATGAPGLTCGSGATAAAAAARLRLAATRLPCLPAAQLLSLHGQHASSTWAHPEAATLRLSSSFGGPAPTVTATPQLTHGGGFSGSGSSPSRQHYAALHAPGSAAQQLVSLRSFRGTAAEQQRMWGGHWDKRHIYGSSRAEALGVVEKLHEEVPVVVPASHQRHLWEVLEFRPDSTCLETWKSPDVMGLHPRDVYLFASDVGLGQRAMLAARGGAILFRTAVCKAVVYWDKAVLFPSRRLNDTVKISQSIKAAIVQTSPLPFELKVLEALLSETARAYANKSKRLAIVAETVLTDINTTFSSSAGELQRLIPIQRKLTEVQNDVQEVLEAIGDVVNDDAEIKKLCLTERQERTQAAHIAAKTGHAQLPPALETRGGRTPEMRMASSIMESYEFKLQGTHSSLKEVLENIEQTRTVWHMQLDHQRNRVLRINLLISIISLGAVTATLPAAFFGMNLSSGLEELSGVFWPVVQLSVLMGGVAAALMYGYWKIGPKRRYKARMRDMRSLRDLLIFHLDDLDDIMDTVKERARSGTPVSKKEFGTIVQQAVRGKPMSKDEVELLYRVFDTNRDGLLELSEMVRIEEHIDDEFAHAQY